VLTFAVTEWAWDNPGHALLLMFPAFSLVNSKQIVCNVTKMEMAKIPGSFFWFLLLPLNRYALELMPQLEKHSRGFRRDGKLILLPESYVALIIFVINLAWYLMWCSKTIN